MKPKRASVLPQPQKILFPNEKIKAGWSNIYQDWHAGCGFYNVGNSCYLNATLQAIFHVPSFVNWLISDTKHRKKCGDDNCIMCAMAKTLLDTQGQHFAATPSRIADRLNDICSNLSPGRQEDAHEFLRHLIDQMDESFLHRHIDNVLLDQFSKNTTPLSQIFGGYFRSTITCERCGNKSETFEHFMELALDIKESNTLDGAIKSFFSEEILEDSTYECEKCMTKVSAVKQTQIEKSPVSLCVQLKRFEADGTKLCKGIRVPLHVDISEHFSRHAEENQQSYYKLVSLVTHIGFSSSAGHYSAVALAPNGRYFEFDDSSVNLSRIQDVTRESNAYLLFYEVRDKVAVNNRSFHSTPDKQSTSFDSGVLSSASSVELRLSSSPARSDGNFKKSVHFGPLTQSSQLSFSNTKIRVKETRPPLTQAQIEQREERTKKALLRMKLPEPTTLNCLFNPQTKEKEEIRSDFHVTAAEKVKTGKRRQLLPID